jgi:hypothetical protein
MTPEREADLKFQARVLISFGQLDQRLKVLEQKIGAFELKKTAATTGVLLLMLEAGKALLPMVIK